MERANPLPPGVYWFDLIGDGPMATFNVWAFENAATVQLITTELHPALVWPDCPVNEDCGPAREWVKFQVSKPTPWIQALGFPNVIGPKDDINSSTDTADNPDPDPSECDAECKLERAAIAVAVIAVGAIVLTIAVKR